MIKIQSKRKTVLLAWGLILPSFVFLCAFTLYPILRTVWDSLFLNDLSHAKAVFTGLGNYIALFQDTVFQKSFWNNLLVAVITVPIDIVLGIAMAQFANSARHAKWLVRLAFFYPTILPMIAASNIWLFFFTPQYGLIGGLNSSWNLLGRPQTVLPSIILMLVWKQSGYLMIFFLAGLQNIPKDVYEAAAIDGADRFSLFRSITWPLLKPVTIFSVIIALTDAYKTVDYLYVMTSGGPNNSSNMLLLYIYQTGFGFWDIGKASAITTVLVGMLLVVSAAYFYRQDRRTYYS